MLLVQLDDSDEDRKQPALSAEELARKVRKREAEAYEAESGASSPLTTSARKRRYLRHHRKDDEELARWLQEQQDREDALAAERVREQEKLAMASTVEGKALLFVEEVLGLVNDWDPTTSSSPPTSKPPGDSAGGPTGGGGNRSSEKVVEEIAKDDMVFLAEAMFRLQDEFRQMASRRMPT